MALNTQVRESVPFPMSCDIYLEADGKKIAVVQSYRAKAVRSSREIGAFGTSEPVATVAGHCRYTLELTRVCACDSRIDDRIDFYSLDNFTVNICKPGKRVIYSQCRWSDIEEDGKLGEPVLEKVTVTAGKRMVQSE